MRKSSIKIFVLSTLLICISFSNVFAQDINDISSLPEQVDLVTGTPIIRIPLWEAQDRDISIPIALNYNASGIRVAQTASWVGLGWNLSVGGVISREVKGLPDDIYITEDNEDYDNELYGWLYSIDNYQGEEFFISERVRDKSYEHFISDMYTGWYFYQPGKNVDAEPDIYHFSFPGGSGKFVFEHDYNQNESDRELLITPHQNLKISYVLNETTKNIDKFEIIDEAGYKYIFKNKETIYSLIIQHTDPVNNPHFPDPTLPFSYSFGNYNRNKMHINYHNYCMNSDRDYNHSFETKDIYTTAWYLTKIVTPLKNEANFSYETEIIEHTEFTNNTFRSFRDTNNENLISSISVDTTTTNFTSRLEAQRLSSIETENLLIEFIADQERNDIQGDNIKALTKINIINKIATPQSIIREFEFSYTYFVDELSDGDYLYDEDNGSYGAKRLKLDAIQEKNGSSTNPQYIFDYYKINNVYGLPNRFSYECDFWGFYTENEATTFIPKIYFYPDLEDDFFRIYPIPGNNDYITLPGSNRQPPSENDWIASIGMLTLIEFPNGGSVEYEYEPYSFTYKGDEYKGGGTRLKKMIISDNETSSQPKEVNYYYDNDGVTSGRVMALPTFGNYDPTDGQTSWETDIDYYNEAYIRYNFNNTNFTDRPIMYEKVIIDKGDMGKTELNFDIPLTLDYEADEQNLLTKIYRSGDDDCFGDNYFYTIYGYYDIYDPPPPPPNYTFNVFPYPKNIDISWKRGNLMSLKRYRKESDGSYLPVQSVKYTYKDFYLNNIEPDTVYGIKIGFLKNCDGCTVFNSFSLRLFSKYSILTNVKNVLESKTEILHDKTNPDNTISTLTEYNYNSLGHLAEVITTNKENTRINRITYNGEYDCGAAGDDMADALIKLQAKNILNVPVESINLLVEDGSVEKTVNASLTLFKDFSENEDTLIRIASALQVNPVLPIDVFNNSETSGTNTFEYDSRYETESILDLYDEYGNLLQSHRPDGAINSDKWNYKYLLSESQIKNSTYTEFEYEGYEYFSLSYLPGWSNFDIEREIQYITSINYHTGKKSLTIISKPSGAPWDSYASMSFQAEDIDTEGKYIFSAWVNCTDVDDQLKIYIQIFYINGSAVSGPVAIYDVDNQGEWQYLKTEVDLSDFQNIDYVKAIICHTGSLSLPAYFDDIRFYPADAIMATQTYDPYIGKTSVSGANEYPVFYEYDDLGRLIRTRDHENYILKEVFYHKKNQ